MKINLERQACRRKSRAKVKIRLPREFTVGIYLKMLFLPLLCCVSLLANAIEVRDSTGVKDNIIKGRVMDESELPLSGIAQSLGFDDAHYFARLLRRFTGKSCRQLRGNGRRRRGRNKLRENWRNADFRFLRGKGCARKPLDANNRFVQRIRGSGRKRRKPDFHCVVWENGGLWIPENDRRERNRKNF